MACTECGEELLAERAELGYDYCTGPACQAKRFRGPTITAIGVNKSADHFVVADDAEIARRGAAGELARKDTGLPADYRAGGRAVPAVPRQPTTRRATPSRPWSSQQETVVRLYHEMGLSPTQIVDRARQHNPRLALTSGLVRTILATLPRASR